VGCVVGYGFGSVLLIGAIKTRLSSEFALRFETLLAPGAKSNIFGDCSAFSALLAQFMSSSARGSFDRPSDSENGGRWAWGV